MLAIALTLAVLMAGQPAPLPAPQQTPFPVGTSGDAGPLVPLDQIRRALEQPPPSIDLSPIEHGSVMFRSQATTPLGKPLNEYLLDLFTLTPFEQQSADWASKPTSVNLLGLAEAVRNAFRANEERRIRAEIQQELDALKK